MVVSDNMNNTQLCALIDSKLSEICGIKYDFGIPKYKLPDHIDQFATNLYAVFQGDIDKFYYVKTNIICLLPAFHKLFKNSKLKTPKEKIWYSLKLLLFKSVGCITGMVDHYIYCYTYIMVYIIYFISGKTLIEPDLMKFDVLKHIATINMKRIGITQQNIEKINELILSLDQINNIKCINGYYYNVIDGIQYNNHGIHYITEQDGKPITTLLTIKDLSTLPEYLIGKYIPIKDNIDGVIKIYDKKTCYCVKVESKSINNYSFWNNGCFKFEFYGFDDLPMVLKSSESTKGDPYMFKWNDLTLFSTYGGNVNPIEYLRGCIYQKQSGIMIKYKSCKTIKIYLQDYEFPQSNSILVSPNELILTIDWLKQFRLFKKNKTIKKIYVNVSHNNTYQSYILDITNYCRNNSINLNINITV